MEVANNPGLITSIPEPLRSVVAGLYKLANEFFLSRRTLREVTSHERRQLLEILAQVAGTKVTFPKLDHSAHKVREMLDWLTTEFVSASIAHQYGSDGSRSDNNPFAQMLTAFYPGYEFGTETVMRLDQHGPILAWRSAGATSILIMSAWGVGHVRDATMHELEVRITRAYFETTVFKTPDGDIYAQHFHAQYDPSRGCTFVGFNERSAKNVFVLEMMPRFIFVPERDEYVRVFLDIREEKEAASQFRKDLLGRGGDDIATRIMVRSLEEWKLIKPLLLRTICHPEQSRVSVLEGKRVGGKPNSESKEHPGVMWKGVVMIPGVTHNYVELQVLLFDAYWDRVHSLGPDSDAEYKWRQWCKTPEDQATDLPPLPAPIQIVHPPALRPEWTRWEHLVSVLHMRLMRKAANPPRSSAEVMAYIDRRIEQLRQQPWKFEL